MDALLVYIVETIWQDRSADAYYDGKYFVLPGFLFSDAEMEGLYDLREWSAGGVIDAMYGRYLQEKKLWQDTITR